MFGILSDIVDGACDKVVRTIDDPIGETLRTVTAPLRDTIEIVEGLTEGELRIKAAARLGADVASGMAVGELLDWYNEVS